VAFPGRFQVKQDAGGERGGEELLPLSLQDPGSLGQVTSKEKPAVANELSFFKFIAFWKKRNKILRVPPDGPVGAQGVLGE
jgi:hypothetical protein